LKEAGFEDVAVKVTNVYDPEVVEGLAGSGEVDALRNVPATSVFVRARKPVEKGTTGG
jgi:hypothetical protein